MKALVGIGCQLASIVGFVIVLHQTGVAHMAWVRQAECIGKGGDYSRQQRGESWEKSGSQEEEEIDRYHQEEDYGKQESTKHLERLQ